MNAYVSPPSTRPEHIGPAELRMARAILKTGARLAEAADAIGATPGALDQAIWRNLGSQAR